MTEKKLGILVRAPGEACVELDLEDAEEALVGRSPDWSRLDTSPRSTKTMTVCSPVVSANHVRIRREGERIHVLDVGSRNGTWVAVPPRGEVIARAVDGPFAVHLAPEVEAAAEVDAPRDAHWTDRRDYGDAICGAIHAWLEAKDLPARITVLSRDPARDEDTAGRIPLATGEELLVEPTRTVGPGWLEALATIERWVVQQNVQLETEETMRAEGLVVASPAMRKAIARVVAAASGDARVLLITGPSGAGKEGLARCFHHHARRAGPFVARNCAMFSKELVRSELFGAEKGAFTGSVQRIIGAVEAANEGTLFLDEIGELPREVQPMLLRFLDHGEYERIGSYGQPKIADVRIVAATNRDLRAAVLEDAFRTDLWFRLSVHVVEVPPLRDRPEDILAYLQTRELPGGRTLLEALGNETADQLLRHPWDGNFRELANFVERTLPLAAQGPISPGEAMRLLHEGSLHPSTRAVPPRAGPAGTDAGDVFATLLRRASDAFAEDHDGGAPRTWDQIKDLVESYLKPILFAELTESARAASIDGVDLRVAAERLRADRGTALKQLRRYFDRFADR